MGFRFIFTVVAFLATGCAAPMTEVVATRQSETIDQHLFKEGDEVWVTYQDKLDIVRIKKAFVLDTDDSVKSDTSGRAGGLNCEPLKAVQYTRRGSLSVPVIPTWVVTMD